MVKKVCLEIADRLCDKIKSWMTWEWFPDRWKLNRIHSDITLLPLSFFFFFFFLFFGNFSLPFPSSFLFLFILLRTYRSNEILVRRRPPTILRYYNIVEKCFAFYKSKKFKGMLLASNCTKHSLLIISSYRPVLTLRVLTFLYCSRDKIPTFGLIDRYHFLVYYGRWSKYHHKFFCKFCEFVKFVVVRIEIYLICYTFFFSLFLFLIVFFIR